MSDYPVTKKDFATKIDDEDVYQAGHMNDVQDEIRSVEDFIGTGKAEQLSLMEVLQDYRSGLSAKIVSGDTINVPASEMMIDERGVRNAAALTRDLADDITASTSTDYYLFTVDDADGTFSLEFRAASTAVDGKRKIATVTTNASDATVIDTITDDDIAPAPSVGVKQVVNVMDGAVATGTTVTPYDDTIPAITEGDEYMTLAITPKSGTNKLVIQVVVFLSNSAADQALTVALHQDSTTDALAAVSHVKTTANKPAVISFVHFMAAGTTSSTTFRVRAGADGAGTTTFNGIAAARAFGGIAASSITITEIQP